MSIKNIVFDVGDVLVDFRYRDLMRDLGFDENAVEFLSKNMVETEFWHELDLGIKTNADGVEKFTKEFPQYKDEVLKFWNNLQGIVKEYDYAAPLIKSLKEAGYKVYILSNYPEETYEMHWPTFKFLEYTDGRIVSAFEKMTKPDERIYRLLEERFGIKLEESIFIDDRAVNIEAASKLGMTAHLFTGYDDLIDFLNI
jgi:putative hydrolase of the HAD superfamily